MIITHDHSQLFHRLFGFGPLLFAALFVLLLVGGRSKLFRDPGTFWHTAAGEIMLATGEPITSDPFTFTFAGQPWRPHSWLSEVGMALLHRLGGYDLFLPVSATIIAALFAGLGTRIVRTGLHPIVAVCITGLAMATAANHFHARPHLLSMALFGVTLVLLAAVESGSRSLRTLFALIPLMILWVNLHGGVMAGFMVVALVFGGWMALGFLGRESPVRTPGQFLTVTVLGISIAATSLVNPYGVEMIRTWLAIAGEPELKKIIVEHAAVDPTDVVNWPFFLFGLVYAGLLAGLRRWPRVTWLLPVLFFALGCDRVRNISLFGIAALVAAADLFPHTIWARRLAAVRPDFYVPPISDARFSVLSFVIPLMVVVPTLILHVNRITCPVFGRDWVRFDEETWPMDLAPLLESEAGTRRRIPLFNDYNLGGFVIGFTPSFAPFVDDRCELAGGAWLRAYDEASRGKDTKEYLRAMQRQYGRFEFALTRAGSAFDEVFRNEPGEWAKIGETVAFRCYRRNGAPK